MLQNKIFQNFFIGICKTFLTILLGFSLIALTVRSVNFLELMVDNGYPVTTYFKYSLLNVFGIIPKFIPFSFLITLIIFISKNNEDNELLILWTSGVKKITITNFLLIVSILVVFLTLLFSIILTPYALNKSRDSLKKENFNSFLPTVRSQQFSDSFKGFTFFVEKKFKDEMQNIFIHDKGNNLKNLVPNSKTANETIVLAQKGLVNKKNLFLVDGQIISKKKNNKNEIIKFDQLKVSLDDLVTSTIKAQKIQETPTLKLLSCFLNKIEKYENYCNENFKKEIISTLNRRITLPFYIPIITLICALLLIRSEKIYFKKYMVYAYGFFIILFTELGVRYTGISLLANYIFILLPGTLFMFLYFFIFSKFSNELKKS